MRTTWMAAATLACAALISTTALAQVSEDAKAVLHESGKAVQEVKGVQMKVKTYATGMLKDIIDLDGTVKVWRKPGSPNAMWCVESGRAKNPGKSDRKLEVVSDGVTVTWNDYEANTQFERPVSDPNAMETANLCRELVLQEFISSTPYQMELNNFPILTKNGINNVGGEVCDIIEAMPATKDRNRTWAISVKDRLPRQIELGTGQAVQKISKITEITELKMVELSDKDFVLKLPFGFKEDRQKAVAPPTPAVNPAMPTTPVKPPELGLKPGTPAPAFAAKDTTGKDISAAAMKGNALVLEFWGTMFKQSTLHAAEMKALAAEFKGKANFVGLACRENSEKAAGDWWTKSGPGYPLIANGDAIAADYKVVGFPSYYVIDGTGNVSAFFQDFPGAEALKTAITNAAK